MWPFGSELFWYQIWWVTGAKHAQPSIKSHSVRLFPSCGNACISNYRWCCSECGIPEKWQLCKIRQAEARGTAKHQYSQGLQCLSALSHTAIEESRIHNTNTGWGQRKFFLFFARVREEKEVKGRKMGIEDVRKWLWQEKDQSRRGWGRRKRSIPVL